MYPCLSISLLKLLHFDIISPSSSQGEKIIQVLKRRISNNVLVLGSLWVISNATLNFIAINSFSSSQQWSNPHSLFPAFIIRKPDFLITLRRFTLINCNYKRIKVVFSAKAKKTGYCLSWTYLTLERHQSEIKGSLFLCNITKLFQTSQTNKQ